MKIPSSTWKQILRIVATILENNQTEDGIKVPAALVPYMGTDIIK